MNDPSFQKALAAFDSANAADPNQEMDDGQSRPRELVHALRLYAWVKRLQPEASEALLLASRCQHLRRWEIPRSQYPQGRAGYLKWRIEMGRFHAEKAEEILRDAGYGSDLIDRVRDILRKKNLAGDAEVQTIEDALCLDFLQYQLAAFASLHEREKVIDILRKTWGKMSSRGQETALALELPASSRDLVADALKKD